MIMADSFIALDSDLKPEFQFGRHFSLYYISICIYTDKV